MSGLLPPASSPLGEHLAALWVAALEKNGFRECDPDTQFARIRNAKGQGPIQLHFRHWLHPDGHEWRQTYIHGPKAEILCAMGFPADAARAPVFAAETIAYHGSIKIAVVDLEPAVEVQHAPQQLPWWGRLMDQMARAYAPTDRELLHSDQPHPDWAAGCFSPGVVYCRPEDPADLSSVEDGLLRVGGAYHCLWLDWLAHLPADSDSAQEPLSWSDYRSHHAAHTPGRPFLRAQFGAEWTEEFLAKHMYGN